MVLRCNECGSTLAGDARFCPKCGEAVVRSEPERTDVDRIHSNVNTIFWGVIASLVISIVVVVMLFSRNDEIPNTIILGGTPVNTVGVLLFITLLVTLTVFAVIAAVRYLTRR